MWTAVIKIGASTPDTFVVLFPPFPSLAEAKTEIITRMQASGFTDIIQLVEISVDQDEPRLLSVLQSTRLNHLGRTFWHVDTPSKLRVLYNPFFPS